MPTGNPIPCTFKYGTTECDTLDGDDPNATRISCTVANGSYQAVFQTGTLDGTPVFFPVDGDNFTPAAERGTATIGPPYATGRLPVGDAGAPLHNFSFTSEVRYWFPFDSSKTYTLKFLGDDDVWVFINRRLAVDLGGIHTAVGCNSLVATCTIGQVIVNAGNNFGMTNGNVYEVVVFQAERQKTSSSYQLTLSAFNGAPTACGPTCGDRVVTPPEQCDNGTVNNTGGYNKCTPDCKLGPYCGDMMVTDAETCDNGRNDDNYGATSGCGAGCKLPARCGDLIVQTEYGEQCDDGTNSGAYGGCTQPVPARRLLRRRQGAEPAGAVRRRRQRRHLRQLRQPEHAAARTASSVRAAATASCRTSTASSASRRARTIPNCTAACRQPGICGDGVKTPPEECDYGAAENNGEYGGCAPGCILAPHCGDARQERPRGVRRRRPRQQLRRLLAGVQAGRPLRRRHDQPALRAVRRRREQRPDGRVFDRLQVQHPVAGVRRPTAAAARVSGGAGGALRHDGGGGRRTVARDQANQLIDLERLSHHGRRRCGPRCRGSAAVINIPLIPCRSARRTRSMPPMSGIVMSAMMKPGGFALSSNAIAARACVSPRATMPSSHSISTISALTSASSSTTSTHQGIDMADHVSFPGRADL